MVGRFKNISKLEPQKKLDFLYHVRNHLEEQFKTPKNITNNKSNIRQLVTMYNYYVTNKIQSKTNSKLSGYLSDKEKIINRSFGLLNPAIKNKFTKTVIGLKHKKKSIQKKKPIKLDIIKVNMSLLENESLEKNKNIKKKIRSNKLFVNTIISPEIKKNSFNLTPKSNTNKNTKTNNINYNTIQIEKKRIFQPKKQENSFKKNNNNNSNKIRKRFSIVQNLSNNTLFKNVRMKSKNIFEILLKNKCETTKNQRLNFFHKITDSENKNNEPYFYINNNIDIRNEDFIKNIYSRNKFNRPKTLIITS